MLMMRELGRYRFLRSTHIAALTKRSLDRTNDRLLRLYHSGYVDRPRAQLDYYPSSGSAPMVYALADRGARLLVEQHGLKLANLEWSRKNQHAGRPFIEHQLETVDFLVALERAARMRGDVRIIHPEEIIESSPEQTRNTPKPFILRASISHRGNAHEIAVIPDLVFGLMFPDSSRRCFMVEIDRGTMPVSRSDFKQTSLEKRLCGYLGVYASSLHEQQFGWKTFRVLLITTDDQRMRSMQELSSQFTISSRPARSLFLFTTRLALQRSDPLSHRWHDGNDRGVQLIEGG